MATVNIKMVAQYAGVSEATVSRVLNNNPTVSEEFRARTLKAIEKLGYQPNRVARRLRASSSDVLGLIVSDIENPFFTSVVRGVEDTAQAAQKSVILCNSDENPAKLKNYLKIMESERVAGLIIAPTSMKDGESLHRLTQLGIPIVLLDRQVDNFEFDSVLVDNVRGAFTGVKHLIDLGYERIAMIGGTPALSNARDRYQGYRNALKAAGLNIDERLIKEGNFKIESGYRLAKELVHASNPPQAIFIANNLMTLGAVRALRELNICVPDDLAIVSFDDTPWANELTPPLTVVSQPTYQLGQTATQLLLNRLAKSDAPFQTAILHTHLIVRKSCGLHFQNQEKSL